MKIYRRFFSRYLINLLTSDPREARMKLKMVRIFSIWMVLLVAFSIFQIGMEGQAKKPASTNQWVSEQPFVFESRQGIDLEGEQVYLVRLQDPPLASYRGGISGLPATNPSARGESELSLESAESQAYRDYLLAKQAQLVSDLEGMFGRKLSVMYQYYAATNGMALSLTANEAEIVRSLPEVAFIQPNFQRQLDTDTTPAWIGAPGLWDGTTTGGLPGTKGEGIIVGIIDTGINPSNPSFADIGEDGYDHTNPWGSGNYVGVCDPANSLYDSTFPCNDKLIGAWGYTTVNGGDPRDYQGHGSHTASTSAGNYTTAQVVGNTISTSRQISGIAPHANIVAYAACCDGATLTAAIDQAVVDGVDVLNYSIGSAAPSDPWTDSDSLAFLSARDAGIFVSGSAGNNGPDPSTVGGPNDAPWIMSNAASTHSRQVTNALVNMSGGSTTPPPDLFGLSFSAGYGPAKIVYAGNYGDALCLNPFAGGTFNGEIVICDRGNNARVDKGANVQAGGAGGMILVNAAVNGNQLVSDDHYLPAVHLSYADGVVLKAWVNDGGPQHNGTIRGTLFETNPAWGDVIGDFSSRGPNRAALDILKPNVSAPGVSVLAAVGIGDPNPPEWTFYDGTSMASPHGAGSAALLKDLHPTWTPAEIQSVLMMTAFQDLTDYDGTLPDPFDMGSGRIDLSLASKTGLVMNETRANYEAANPDTGGNPSTLNMPSLGKGACYQTCSWNRTFRSTLSTGMTWTIDLSALGGMDLTVSPTSFNIPAGGTQAITVNADVRRATPNAWAFGEVRLIPSDPAVPTLHLPVGAFANSGNSPQVFDKTANIDIVEVGQTITYKITLTHKSLTAKTYDVSDPIPANSSYVNGSATGGLSYNSGTNTLSWNGQIPAGDFVINEEGRSGYISMGDLGAPPVDPPTNKDAGCLLVTLNDLNYFGSLYTQGIWSVNGTLQAGVSGLSCAGNTNGQVPAAATPNNLLAPFWTDLDFTNGGAWYFVGVSYNGAPHTVFSWENVPLKTGSGTASFQLWFEEGTDNIWFTYEQGGMPTGTPNATVGAENSGGTVGANYYYNGTGKLPDGTVDLVLGPLPVIKEFTFQVTANAVPSVTNAASMTQGSSSYNAYAFTDVYTTNTWLGNTQDWQTTGNWSRGVVPGQTDRVVIPTQPSGGMMPVLPGNAAVFGLEIQPGASLDLATYLLTVQDALLNQGTLRQTLSSVANNQAASLLNVTNASGAQDKYHGVEIKPSTGSMGSTTVAIRGQSQCTTTDPTDTVNRCFEITPSVPQTAAIRFYYQDNELDGHDPQAVQAWHSNGGTSWSLAGTVDDRGLLPTGTHWVDVSGVTAYSPFALSETVSGPTVVQLVRLAGRDQPGKLFAVVLIGLLSLAPLGHSLGHKTRKVKGG
jgi:uncharacterized repeat protein (TIGR01451 family)